MSGDVVEEALRALRCAVDGLLRTPLSRLADDDVPALVRGVEVEVRRLAALDHRFVGELDRRSSAGRFGRASVADLLVSLLRVTPAEARARVLQAGDLGARHTLQGEVLPPLLPVAADAVASGDLSAGLVAVIAKAVDAVPVKSGAEVPGIVEATLVHAARHEHPGRLARTAALLLARIDPDGPEPIARENERRRELSLTVAADGSGRLTGRLTAETAAVWTAVLDALSAPATGPGAEGAKSDGGASDRGASGGAGSDGAGSGGAGSAAHCGPVRTEFTPGDPAMDQRSPSQRRHDGFLEAGRRLLRSGALPPAGGVPVTVLVRTTSEDLAAVLSADAVPGPRNVAGVGGVGGVAGGVALTDRGALWPVRDLLDVLSDAEIVPVHHDGQGAVLHLGRTRRLANRAQRLALHARDGGCTFPGCDRPAPWTEVHHVAPWQDNGTTDIGNLALLCRFHHRNVDSHGWTMRMVGGVPEWIPPPWIDPSRRPQRNTVHRPPDMMFGDCPGVA